METTWINSLLRTIVGALETPVILVLMVLLAATIIIVGSLLVETFTERRLMKEKIPVFVTTLQEKSVEQQKGLIQKCGLLTRQKEVLIYLLDHAGLPAEERESLAKQLLYEEEQRYQKTITITDVVVRIAPMFGLLGTLIPLGPGLIALSQGDTATLSKSLMTAFDTTAAGLIVAAINFLVSTIRKRWYDSYVVGLETIMEILLAELKKEDCGKC